MGEGEQSRQNIELYAAIIFSEVKILNGTKRGGKKTISDVGTSRAYELESSRLAVQWCGDRTMLTDQLQTQ